MTALKLDNLIKREIKNALLVLLVIVGAFIFNGIFYVGYLKGLGFSSTQEGLISAELMLIFIISGVSAIYINYGIKRYPSFLIIIIPALILFCLHTIIRQEFEGIEVSNSIAKFARLILGVIGYDTSFSPILFSILLKLSYILRQKKI